MSLTHLKLTIPDTDWEQISDVNGDPSARLLSSLCINGLMLHVEAWVVTTEGEQHTIDPLMDDDLGYLIMTNDTTFRTTKIMGRDYVIIATPFGS